MLFSKEKLLGTRSLSKEPLKRASHREFSPLELLECFIFECLRSSSHNLLVREYLLSVRSFSKGLFRKTHSVRNSLRGQPESRPSNLFRHRLFWCAFPEIFRIRIRAPTMNPLRWTRRDELTRRANPLAELTHSSELTLTHWNEPSPCQVNPLSTKESLG